MRILGIVPARAGSKGMPGKNTRPIAGKSPIERAYEAGLGSNALTKVVLSSNDVEALRIAQRTGMAHLVRPADLARDQSPMLQVAEHALDVLMGEKGEAYDAVMILQPTSPLRQPEHVRAAVQLLLQDSEATGVCSVTAVPAERCPHYLMKIEAGLVTWFMPDGAAFTRRQDVPRAYQRCGTIFLTRVEALRTHRNFYGSRCLPLELDPAEAVNVDSPEDWARAEQGLYAREGRRWSA